MRGSAIYKILFGVFLVISVLYLWHLAVPDVFENVVSEIDVIRESTNAEGNDVAEIAAYYDLIPLVVVMLVIMSVFIHVSRTIAKTTFGISGCRACRKYGKEKWESIQEGRVSCRRHRMLAKNKQVVFALMREGEEDSMLTYAFTWLKLKLSKRYRKKVQKYRLVEQI